MIQPESPSRKAVREAIVAVLFVALAVLMTWPLVLYMQTSVSDAGDPLLVAWILDWDWRAMLHNTGELFSPPMFFPSRYALAFSDHMMGIALLLFPVRAAGVSALPAYNVALLLAFAFAGWGAYVLCRSITSSAAASVAGGVFYAFVPYRFDQLSHLQILWSGWLPLSLAALIHYFRRPDWKRAVLFAAVYLMNALTTVHWLMFGTVALGLSGLLLVLLHRERLVGKDVARILIGWAGAVVILIPFLLPYAAASRLYGFKRHPRETLHFSATPSEWLVAAPRNQLWGRDGEAAGHEERRLFPGLTVIALSLAGLLLARRIDFSPRTGWAADAPASEPSGRLLGGVDTTLLILFVASLGLSIHPLNLMVGPISVRASSAWLPVTLLVAGAIARLWIRIPGWLRPSANTLRAAIARSRLSPDAWCAMLWIVIGALGSLGMRAFFHQFLFRIHLFQNIRAPARWAMIAYAGLAVTAAIGVAALARKVGGGWRSRGVATAASVLLIAELLAAPIRWQHVGPAPPLYRWLASQPVQTIMELPLGPQFEAMYVFRATGHEHRLVNGVSGFYPASHQKLVEMFGADPIPEEFLMALQKIPVSLVIIHRQELGERLPAVDAWLQRETGRGRLKLVRTFEGHEGGDAVYQLAALR